MQYVMHFPKGEKYVSLLRNASSEDAQRVLEAERQRIRAKVKQQLADIAMITQADEGLLQATQQPADPVKPAAVQQVCTLSAEDRCFSSKFRVPYMHIAPCHGSGQPASPSD